MIAKNNHKDIFQRVVSRVFAKASFRSINSWSKKQFSWTDKKLTFCLSFDCDNEEDADTFPELMRILKNHNLRSSFAVCGQMVEESPEAYRLLIQCGHEIMNHGYSRHMEAQPNGEVTSTFFYNNLDKQTIRKEIKKNHQVVKNVLGYEMVGFRAPHFGTFQQREQILLIHSILKELGYLYDSSTLMVTAKRLNLVDTDTIIEFPLSPMVGSANSVFDSWGFLKAPNKRRKEEDFFSCFKMMIDSVMNSRRSVLLNIYVDPSHIMGFEGFAKSLEYIDKIREHIYNDSYRNLLGKYHPDN